MATQIPTTDERGVYDLEETPGAPRNVNTGERIASAIAGGVMLGYGLTRRNVQGALLALGGAALLHRGATGSCLLYRSFGFDSANAGRSPVASVRHGRGIKFEKSVHINRSREELFAFWRNLENLPRFMTHLESVRDLGENRSYWRAKAPAGMTVEWEAEVYREVEPELIAWRSLENSQVHHAGSVIFDSSPDGRGTIVRVALNYEPPGGRIGDALARFLGENPEQQIEEDLLRFKQVIEADIPVTYGRPGAEPIRPTAM